MTTPTAPDVIRIKKHCPYCKTITAWDEHCCDALVTRTPVIFVKDILAVVASGLYIGHDEYHDREDGSVTVTGHTIATIP